MSANLNELQNALKKGEYSCQANPCEPGSFESPPSSVRAHVVYKAHFIFHALIMSDLIRNDAALRETLVTGLHLMLPDSLRKPVLEFVTSPEKFPLPDKGTISRWRMCVDAAYVAYTRRNNQADEFVRFYMIDASTQGGRDYELSVVSEVRKSSLVELLVVADSLIDLRPEANNFLARNPHQ